MTETVQAHVLFSRRACAARRAVILVAAILACSPASAGLDEFRIKREAVYAFVRTPQVTQEGDRVQIRFETKGYCDVTIAIEEAVPEGVRNPRRVPDTLSGRIVRHLASGVLGPNAPEPFARDSKSQTIAWDGKDDQGTYIDEREGLVVRVSLGLNPRFERSLFWSPYKRIGRQPPMIAPAEEGVYVFDALGVDHLKLYDHDGTYVRTVYPFPAHKLGSVKDLDWRVFPQDNALGDAAPRLPIKHGFVQASLLSSGTSGMDDLEKHAGGVAATAVAAWKGRVALVYHRLNRLAPDGGTGGLPLAGAKTGIPVTLRRKTHVIGPSSAAFSPDGRWVYLTGYVWTIAISGWEHNVDSLHGVLRIPYEGDGGPEVFKGKMTIEGHGTDNAHFRVPASVACDARGRVYVADYINDRVQVYAPDGTHLKTIRAPRPAKVQIHHRTQEIYVFSLPMNGVSPKLAHAAKVDRSKIKGTQAAMTRFGPFENPKPLGRHPLPLSGAGGGRTVLGQMYHVSLDSWADPPTLWVAPRKPLFSENEVTHWGINVLHRQAADQWVGAGIRLLTLKDGKWETRFHFGEAARTATVRVKPSDFSRQRLYVNPKNGKLYVAEDLGFAKSFMNVVEIDPETGRIEIVELPFETEDLAFDLNGHVYLRTDTYVVRYNPETWTEVPWDYGIERRNLRFSYLGVGRQADADSALPTPGRRPVCWHQGGMAVSPRGHLVVSCCSREKDVKHAWKNRYVAREKKPYVPTMYPGRARWNEVHVWDRHGRIIYEDAIPGLTIHGGMYIDKDDNLYVMAAPSRVLDGKRYFNEMTGTVIKVRPKQVKILSAGRAPIPLPEEDRPKRPMDIANSRVRGWVDGAEWFYGGAGYFGFNPARAGGGCDCWHSRFALDYFARSFVPETDHYSVAVLDSSGNLILRVGRYGNVDDGVPLKRAVPKGVRNLSSKVPDTLTNSPLGGDEVGLVHAAYVGTHTDRRLFIHDAGSSRIVSVKLDYHATERVPLMATSGAQP